MSKDVVVLGVGAGGRLLRIPIWILLTCSSITLFHESFFPSGESRLCQAYISDFRCSGICSIVQTSFFMPELLSSFFSFSFLLLILPLSYPLPFLCLTLPPLLLYLLLIFHFPTLLFLLLLLLFLSAYLTLCKPLT